MAAIINTAEWEFQRALSLFSQGLGDRPFILGDAFSAADILLAHTLSWAAAFKQPLTQDNLQAYNKRLLRRPALERAKQREQAESK